MEERKPRRKIRHIMFAGLLLLVPAALTAAVVVWLFRSMDGMLGPVIAQLTGRQIPGLGLLATLGMIFLLGLVSTNVLGKRLVSVVELLIHRIPIVRSLYASTKGVLSSLIDRPADAFKRVVLFEYPRAGVWSIGFVTGTIRRNADFAPHDDVLTIFVPTAPNPTSGFLVLVPRSSTTELPITVEEGVRMVISGGILRPPFWSDPATS